MKFKILLLLLLALLAGGQAADAARRRPQAADKYHDKLVAKVYVGDLLKTMKPNHGMVRDPLFTGPVMVRAKKATAEGFAAFKADWISGHPPSKIQIPTGYVTENFYTTYPGGQYAYVMKHINAPNEKFKVPAGKEYWIVPYPGFPMAIGTCANIVPYTPPKKPQPKPRPKPKPKPTPPPTGEIEIHKVAQDHVGLRLTETFHYLKNTFTAVCSTTYTAKVEITDVSGIVTIKGVPLDVDGLLDELERPGYKKVTLSRPYKFRLTRERPKLVITVINQLIPIVGRLGFKKCLRGDGDLAGHRGRLTGPGLDLEIVSDKEGIFRDEKGNADWEAKLHEEYCFHEAEREGYRPTQPMPLKVKLTAPGLKVVDVVNEVVVKQPPPPPEEMVPPPPPPVEIREVIPEQGFTYEQRPPYVERVERNFGSIGGGVGFGRVQKKVVERKTIRKIVKKPPPPKVPPKHNPPNEPPHGGGKRPGDGSGDAPSGDGKKGVD